VSREDLIDCHLDTILTRKGGLVNFLSKLYPNQQWVEEKFISKQKKSSQWYLYKLIKEILPPNIEVIEEHLFSTKSTTYGFSMTVDIYIPSLNLAFEYQGLQHYNNHALFGDLKYRKELDKERDKACGSMGITYIEVPYWWQRDKESIVVVLQKRRPDILAQQHIPEVIPFSYPV